MKILEVFLAWAPHTYYCQLISISDTSSSQHFPSPNPKKKKKEKRKRGKTCPSMDMFLLLQRRNSYYCIVLVCNKRLQVMQVCSQHFGSKKGSPPTSPLLFGRLYKLSDPWGHRQLVSCKKHESNALSL